MTIWLKGACNEKINAITENLHNITSMYYIEWLLQCNMFPNGEGVKEQIKCFNKYSMV